MHTQQRSPISPNLFQSSHSRWIALTHRAPSSHSSFLYGVKSTKIYCRPTCPARLARRANVVFYDTTDQARRDGFRPCRRCKPDNAGFVGEREEVVARVIALLRIKKDESTMKRGLKELAKEVGVTPSYLCRVFKKTMGVTIRAYMVEFERAASEDETESSVQSPNEPGSDVAEVRTGPLTSATTARSCLPITVDSLKGGSEEENVGDVEEALDFNFNLDEWIWTENLLNDSIYECTT
ncbi:metal binding domain of Ada-domain-containing protein [Aspergillus egyptiacus]|nr:metal binding domain of Ada-domain-containing protein [Aspergillus egyptiacus]